MCYYVCIISFANGTLIMGRVLAKRTHRDKGSVFMRKIKLTQGYKTMVDDEWYDYLNQWRWYVLDCTPTIKYAVRQVRVGKYKQKVIRMHRVVSMCPTHLLVDHINRDGLDNRAKNLKPCTQVENQINRKLSSNNKSGFNGVHWNKREKRWLSEVSSSGKKLTLGGFKDKKLAIRRRHLFDKFNL